MPYKTKQGFPAVEGSVRPVFQLPPNYVINTQRLDEYSRAAVSTDGSPATNEPVYEYTLRAQDLRDDTGALLVAVLVKVNCYSALGNQAVHFMLNDASVKSATIDTTSTANYSARIKIDPFRAVNKLGIAFAGDQICTMVTCTIDGVYVG